MISVPQNPQIIIAATTKGIYKTSNAFDASPFWELVHAGDYFDLAVKPGPPGQNGYILYASAEYKKSNTFIYSYLPPPYVNYLPHSALIKSIDSGDAWYEVSSINDNLPYGTYDVIRVNLESSEADLNFLYVYITKSNGIDENNNAVTSDGYIKRYNYSTEIITHFINAPTENINVDPGRQGYAISPVNANEMYIGCVNLFKLMQGPNGLYWQMCEEGETHDDIHELVFNKNGNEVWVASDGGLAKKTGYSTCNWVGRSNGLGIKVCTWMDHSNGTYNGNTYDDYVIGGWDTGANLFKNDQSTWNNSILGTDVFHGAMDIITPGTFYLTSNIGGVEKFVNYQPHSNVTCPGNYFYCDINIINNSIDANRIYQTSYDYLYRSIDKGENWEICSPPDFNASGGYVVYDAYTAPSDSKILYVKLITPGWVDQLDNLIYMTNDITVQNPTSVQWYSVQLPAEWNQSNGFEHISVSDIEIDDETPNKFWISTPDSWNDVSNYDYKIFKCENGIYTNITGNLKSFNPSVFSIVHVPGSLNGIFISTDAGVFYRDDNCNDWIEFNKGLPGIMIKGLKLKIKNSEKFLIAATFGRGLWETSLNCIYNNNPMVIESGTIIWNFPRSITSDVIIKSGATLTITTQINFSLNSKIIVERGGKLIIDGGELASACNGLWQGIEVWGTRGVVQNTYNSGKVLVKNNGTIRNARCAINVVKMNGTQPDVDYSGGIVTCDNAKFINNKTSISFYPYNNPHGNNLSHIQNTLFLTDNNYVHTTDLPVTLVNLNGVKGIPLCGCTFKNVRNEIDNTKRGIGLSTYASGFYVTHLCTNSVVPCDNYQRSLFEGLYYGVRTLGNGTTSFVGVENSDFNNNIRGIYMGGINNAVINKNSIHTKQTTQLFPSSGIYLDNCSGYSIQENTVHGNYALQSTYETGIVINNSGTSPNEIYNNTFTQLQNGITAQDNNLGLVCKCNDFDSVKIDQSVLVSGSPGSLGIAPMQGASGSVTAPAGNTFSLQHAWPLHQLPESDLKNQGAGFQYYHHVLNTTYRVIPEYYSSSIGRQITIWDYDKSTACPSRLTGGGGGTPIESSIEKLVEQQTLIDSLETGLDELVDGGNTEETTADIVFSNPDESLEIYNDLLSKSPYLSDTVMTEAATKEEVLSNPLLHDILVANPQSATSEGVLDQLDQRVDPMPEDLYNEILEGENILAPLTAEKASIAALKTDNATMYYHLMNRYIGDTTQYATDSLLYLLDVQNTAEAAYLQAFLHLNNEDFSAMNSTLSGITSEFDLSNEELILHGYYQQFFALLQQMQTDTLPDFQADSLTIDQLLELLENAPEPVKSYSRNILIASNAIEYHEPYLYDDGLKSSSVKKKHHMGPPTKQVSLQVFPNPAKDYIIMRYNLANELYDTQETAVLEMVTTTGQVIKSLTLQDVTGQVVFSTKTFVPGVYIIHIKGINKKVETTKFTVVH